MTVKQSLLNGWKKSKFFALKIEKSIFWPKNDQKWPKNRKNFEKFFLVGINLELFKTYFKTKISILCASGYSWLRFEGDLLSCGQRPPWRWVLNITTDYVDAQPRSEDTLDGIGGLLPWGLRLPWRWAKDIRTNYVDAQPWVLRHHGRHRCPAAMGSKMLPIFWNFKML